MSSPTSDVNGFLQRFYENYTRETLAKLILHRLAGADPPSYPLELLEPLLTDAPRARLITWLATELASRLVDLDEWTAYVSAKTEELRLLWGMNERRATTGALRQAVVLGLRPSSGTYKDSLLPNNGV
jgi:hypothetical protein